jgi:heptosyltransferase-2/heptosyltransferase-3
LRCTIAMPPSPEVRPVVIRFPALGDTVLLTTLIRALALRYGTQVDVLASGAWVPEVLAHNPHLGELRLIVSRRAPYWLTPSQWSAVRSLKGRARAGAPIYFCERDEFGARFLARAVTDPRLYVRAWDHPFDTRMHWVDWYLEIANLTPASLHAPPPPVQAPALTELFVTEVEQARVDGWLQREGWAAGPLVLMQPGHKKTFKRGRIGTAEHSKHWPAERWAAVARGVLQRLPRARVLVHGTAREWGLVQEIVTAAADPRVVNIVRGASVARLLALARRATAMVTVDTGPAHVAAAMDCPMVVLYGAFGAARWKPRTPSADVVALGPEQDNQGTLMDLPVERVLQAFNVLRLRA